MSTRLQRRVRRLSAAGACTRVAVVGLVLLAMAQGDPFSLQVATERPGDMYLAEWCSEWGQSDPDALANANSHVHAIRAYLENSASSSTTPAS